MMDIFKALKEYTDRNFFIEVDDKVPIFLCSIGTHLFNTANKCSQCDFDPAVNEDPEAYIIEDCPMRHNNFPFYTPMSRLPDTRIHILMRGPKGSGKSILIDLFLAEGTGLLWNNNAYSGEGFRTMIGPNSITEAGMFGSVNEGGEIAGRPLAREMCGGFLGFEEFSAVSDASKKDHSMDMKNQLLTSTDNGRVNKALKGGWVRYTTRYTLWAGTQPARFELESGLDRRMFIIDIDMTAEKELLYKKAQRSQMAMPMEERAELVTMNIEMKEWFVRRQEEVTSNPPQGIVFGDDLEEWLMQPAVRSFESDLFRRICIGYYMMQPEWKGGVMFITLDERLRHLLERTLKMRREVMDADLQLIKSFFWDKEVPRSTVLKEVERMVTGDYQAAKRWIEDCLCGQSWYFEWQPSKSGRGRKGVMCRFSEKEPDESKVSNKIRWGEENEVRA